MAGRQGAASLLLSSATSAAPAGAPHKRQARAAAAARCLRVKALLSLSRGVRSFPELGEQDLVQVHEDDEALLELGHARM
jgi:hypothetical protein